MSCLPSCPVLSPCQVELPRSSFSVTLYSCEFVVVVLIDA